MTEKSTIPRKIISVILADTDGPYNSQLWSAIQKASRTANVDLIVFEGRSVDQVGSEKQHNLIFDLAAKIPSDGYILMSSLIGVYVDKLRLIEFSKPFIEKPQPVISFSIELPDTVSFLVDSKSGLRALVEHLTDHHGFRRIAFVKGPEKNDEAIDRFQVFTEVMAERNLPVDPCLVQPGDFSPRAGYLAVKKLNENGELPVECIVCSNDEMAMGVYLYCREQVLMGNEFPACFVTGFDNTKNAQISRPGLTTVSQPFENVILDAMMMIAKTAESLEAKTLVYPSELVIRDSCGCELIGHAEFSDDLFLKSVRSFRVHQFMQTFSMVELFDKTSSLFAECGIGDCYIVAYDKPVNYPEQNSVPEASHLLFAWQGGQDFTSIAGNSSFPTSNLLPQECLKVGRNRNLLVKPLFFTHEHLGYMVFEPLGEDTRNYEPIRGQLSNSLKIISLLIEQQEMSRKLADAVSDLQRHNKKLNVLSLQDELTGLYNRRGFFNAAKNLINSNDNLDITSLLIFIDIDRMKIINDEYGHSAGDLALRMTASVLRMAVREDDIVARIGGDEFVILARYVQEKQIQSIRDRLYKLVNNYNEASDKEWKLDLSLGIVSFQESGDINLDTLMDEADTALYKEKNQKKLDQKFL